MANSKSAEKRIEINKRNCLRNKYYKTSVRTLIKRFFTDLESCKNSPNLDQKKNLQKTLSSVYSLLDKGTKKNIFHKNTVARQKTRLAGYLKAV
jgi:small subunit ribosomal protein S20